MRSPRKSDKKFLIPTFSWTKQTSLTQDLKCSLNNEVQLQVEFITGIQLICYFCTIAVLCWAQLLTNMAVGDLTFYYTLYLWVWDVWFQVFILLLSKWVQRLQSNHLQKECKNSNVSPAPSVGLCSSIKNKFMVWEEWFQVFILLLCSWVQ